jgi:hypothetical protein
VAYGWRKAGQTGLVAVAATVPIVAACAGEDGAESENSPLSMVIFGSMEAGPTKTFLSVGMKRALGGGLARSGFRLFLKAGGSQEETRRQRPRGTTYKSESQAMLGYEWRIGDSFLALYAGSEMQSEQRIEPVGASFVETRYGARLQADLWSTPRPGLMLQASAYASTLDGRLWARAATGWRVPLGFYAGPEIEAYRERGYRKLRLGLHLTGLRLLGLEWRLSGGWQRSSDRPSEFYATLGLHWQR